MSHYSSHTQPRRSVGRTRPPLPPLFTLPRPSSQHMDHSHHHHHTMGRPVSTSMTPKYKTPEGELTLTKKILSTASQTGSTRDLRVLLNDALALTEKLNSVSSSISRRSSTTSYEHNRLSNTSVFPKSPGAYSETGSVFRSHSVENGLDFYSHDASQEHYETSASLAATPVRKNMRPNLQNGHRSPSHHSPPHHSPPHHSSPHHSPSHHSPPHHSPPHHSSPHHSPSHHSSPHRSSTHHSPAHHGPPHHSPSHHSPPHHGPPHHSSPDHSPPHHDPPHRSPPLTGTPLHRGSSPLLHNKRSSTSDYTMPNSAPTSRSLSQNSKSGSADEEGPSRSVSQDDDVDVGLDCIAQLEALEKELQSYKPATYPQGSSPPGGSKEHSINSSQDSSVEGHYEVDPYYIPTKKEISVPPSQRVGGRPSVADFVDELTEVEHQVSQGPEGSDPHRARGMTSSTATRELDELMANLSKFEPASGKTEPSQTSREAGRTKSTAMDNLNSMLGSLDEDMTKRHGVDTAPKGVCAACNKPILTKVVNALGCQWHKEHFTCAQCDVELGSSTYYESNGRPYCEKDYHELFAPRCAYCNGPILERVLRALDKTWHKEHFFCTLCGKDFGPEGFHEKDGKAFCRECYYEKFAPRCKRCEKAIMEGFITALSSQWHPECFCCKVCEVTFPRGNYFDHEGEPHCEIHYHASRGTLCASCQKPVTGKCITAMGRKWHPEHFTCAFCLKLLNKGTFKEHRHNPYCQPCYIKLFG